MPRFGKALENHIRQSRLDILSSSVLDDVVYSPKRLHVVVRLASTGCCCCGWVRRATARRTSRIASAYSEIATACIGSCANIMGMRRQFGDSQLVNLLTACLAESSSGQGPANAVYPANSGSN